VSETPRTDAAYSIYDLRKVAQDIERELNAANAIIRQQQLLDEKNLGLQDRIERLEEALERLFNLPNDCCCELSNSSLDAWKNAHESLKAKEAKL
jgi:hypothetical protein